MSYPPDDRQTPPYAGPYPPGAGYPQPNNPGYPPAVPGPYPPQPAAGPGAGQSGAYPPPPGAYPPPPGAYPPQPEAYPPPPGAFHPPAGGFAQSGQPYGGHPAAGFSPPPKKSHAGKILLIGGLVLLLLCVGGGTLFWLAIRDSVGAGVDASRTRMVAPDTLAGRPKVTDADLQRASEEIVRGMQTEIEHETSAVAAFYGDRTAQELIMIAGVSGMVTEPEAQLNETVNGLSTQITVRNMASIKPGPLGGFASCGDGETNRVPLGICVWASRGSIGMFVMYFSSRDEAESDFVTIRGQIESRS